LRRDMPLAYRDMSADHPDLFSSIHALVYA
jgi:hypothetical protein